MFIANMHVYFFSENKFIEVELHVKKLFCTNYKMIPLLRLGYFTGALQYKVDF